VIVKTPTIIAEPTTPVKKSPEEELLED